MAVPYRAPTFSAQLEVMSRVIVAMVLREMKTRFGRYKFGIVWVFLEPMLYLTGFLALRLALENRIPFGQNLALFVLTGVLVFRTVTSIANRSLTGLTANRALLAYPPVKPVDVILARIMLETLVMAIVWVIFLSLLAITSEQKIIIHIDLFAEAVGAIVLLATGLGVFNAVMAALFPTWERIWGLVRLPLLFLSGLFYVPILMPPWFQAVLSWNPILHCVEWLRTGTYVTYEPLLDKPYVLGFGLLALAAGLLVERGYRHIILSSG